MARIRLDQALVARRLVATRSQAESYIKLGEVKVNGEIVTKPGHFVGDDADIKLTATEQYVSRAALKLASVAQTLKLDFKDKIVLDVGSSTGGFTDYALQHGAQKVIDVEVGTSQLHPSLRGNPKIELHEQTDIRIVVISKDGPWKQEKCGVVSISAVPDIIVIDVSFISLREIIPHVSRLMTRDSILVAMVKPQFEVYAEQKQGTAAADLKHSSTSLGFRTKVLNKGVIKNDRMRRDILKDFETWVTNYCVIVDKADSQITGAKGNQERFYKLRQL